jgi:hypothetical protein
MPGHIWTWLDDSRHFLAADAAMLAANLLACALQ